MEEKAKKIIEDQTLNDEQKIQKLEKLGLTLEQMAILILENYK